MNKSLSVIFKFLLLIYFQTGNSEIVNAQSIDTNQTQNLPDLWRSNIDVYPQVLNPGSYITAFSVVNNSGNGKALSSLTYYYLSKDSIARAPYDTLQGFEYYLGNSYVGSIEPGLKYLDSTGFQIPQYITPGDYYLHFRTDAGDSIQESNEYNNLAVVKIKIGSGSADLRPDSLFLLSYDFAPGSFVEGQLLVSNIGDGPANGHFSGYYLSSDQILDGQDTLLGDSYNYWIGAGSAEVSTAYLNIPSGTQPGEYYIIAKTDYLNLVSESDETNNTLVSRINIHKLDADLLITGNDSTTSYYGGATINGYILNQGTTSSLPTDIAFYLSNDRNLDTNDIRVGMDYISGINPSGEWSYKYSVNAGSDDNFHYIITKVDNSNIIPEINEENNLLYTFINYVKPDVDLQIENPRIYDSLGVQGGSTPVSYIVKNTGSTSSSYYTYTYFYISKDTIFSNDDIYAGYNYDGTVLGDSSLYKSGSVYLPYDITSGKYYVIFAADAYNANEETNEYNNYASAPITIEAPYSDLAIELSIPSSTIRLGEYLPINYTEKNLGNGYQSYYITSIVLSSDSIYNDSLDTQLTEKWGYGLAPFESRTESDYLYLGNSINAGEYFVIAKITSYYENGDTNKYNNTSFSKIKVIVPNIDLSIKTPRVNPSKVIMGKTTELSGYVYNDGTDYSNSPSIAFYLSKTETSADSSNGYYLGSTYVSSVEPKSHLPFNYTVTIPTYISPGEYYVVYKVGSYNISETNLNNNVAFKKITIEAATVDLSVKSASVKSKVTVEKPVSVKATVSNAGNTDAPYFSLGYYLSNDENYSSDDIYLGTSNVYGMLYKSSIPVSGEIVIPNFVQAGTYKLLFVADNYNYVYETNENNNVFAKSIEVKNPHFPTDSIINPGNGNDTIIAPPILPKASIDIIVAPNPAGDIINAHIHTTETSNTVEYELYDSFGLKSKSGIINTADGNFSVPAFDLSPGIYLLKVSYQGAVETIRVYKE